MENCMVAVASDGDKVTADLLPSDWELIPLAKVSEEYGVLMVEGEVLAGHRMKLMVGLVCVRPSLVCGLSSCLTLDLSLCDTCRPSRLGGHELIFLGNGSSCRCCWRHQGVGYVFDSEASFFMVGGDELAGFPEILPKDNLGAYGHAPVDVRLLGAIVMGGEVLAGHRVNFVVSLERLVTCHPILGSHFHQ